ncbi:hypothetical protein PYCC9005_004750 [Savitreella phatthalungensis]
MLGLGAGAGALALGLLGRAFAVNTDCACGFLDPVTGDLWTDSTIIYFNETTPDQIASTPDFISLNFTNIYEDGYDATFRQACYPSNLGLTDSALRMVLSAAQPNHVSVGSGLRTTRQDIQYASIRAYMQPAPMYGVGGSAMSMYYHFNVSQSISLDVVTGNTPAASTVNYRVSMPRVSLNPYNYTFYNVSQDTAKVYEKNEWRIDWTRDRVNYFSSLNHTASWNLTRSQYTHGMPSAPGPIYFKHWATGGATTQGPPMADTFAEVGYIRIFFNSTISSTDDNFGAQCRILQTPTCSTDDNTLRGSSTFTADSAKRWMQDIRPYKAPKWSIYGVAVAGVLFLLIVIHAIFRRLYKFYSVPKELRPVHPPAYAYKLDRFALHGELTREMIKEKKRNEKAEKKNPKKTGLDASPVIRSREIDPETASLTSFVSTDAGGSVRGFSSLSGSRNSKIIAAAIPTMYYSRPGASKPKSKLAQAQDDEEDEEQDERLMNDQDEDEIDREADEEYENLPQRESLDQEQRDQEGVAFAAAMKEIPEGEEKGVYRTLDTPRPQNSWFRRFFMGKQVDKQEVKQEVIKANNRIDYLDGLRGLCCLLVSLVHYSLSFYHGFVTPDNPKFDHYGFVNWIRITIAPIFFTANFGIGVFFVLSSRLIGIRYLKNGLLADLAGATFRRVPRLAFPVLVAVVLTYFLLAVGATMWLKFMPAITWSNWPYAAPFRNPGYFFNEFLALMWVTPPQLPQIIYNYCTGVLWTIPVTIQGSWLIFLGVIVVKEIKNPHKRFVYYGVCMLLSWYALSWGYFFWAGLAICDLDFQLKYRAWVGPMGPRKILVVSILTILVFFSIAVNYLQSLDIIVLPLYEYGIHPDLLTGKTIRDSPSWGYPPFQYPQVFSLFGSVGLLMLCDLSTGLQWVFNIRFLRTLGFYSYSVYLLHGLVFWSWGSWVTVRLGVLGWPYWANQLVNFTSSYLVLTAACYVWSPFADVFMMKGSTALWRWAQGRAFFATIL